MKASSVLVQVADWKESDGDGEHVRSPAGQWWSSFGGSLLPPQCVKDRTLHSCTTLTHNKMCNINIYTHAHTLSVKGSCYKKVNKATWGMIHFHFPSSGVWFRFYSSRNPSNITHGWPAQRRCCVQWTYANRTDLVSASRPGTVVLHLPDYLIAGLLREDREPEHIWTRLRSKHKQGLLRINMRRTLTLICCAVCLKNRCWDFCSLILFDCVTTHANIQTSSIWFSVKIFV